MKEDSRLKDPVYLFFIGTIIFFSIFLGVIYLQMPNIEKEIQEKKSQIQQLPCDQLRYNILDGYYDHNYKDIKDHAMLNWNVRCHGGE